ncbi:MAG: hypothetical protein HYX32_14325, partial [Actinobacteria bacterium]|nr:hypothetical protein [Actinomycetota bacterium]
MFEAGLGGRARCDEVVAVSAGAERAEAGQVLTLADWHRDHGWLVDGQVTAVAWLVHHVGLLRKDANRLMKMARLCAA